MTATAVRSKQSRSKRRASVLLLLAIAFTIFAHPAMSDVKRKFITIGSGQPGGVYYPVAQTLCRIVNETLKQQGYYCSAEPTPGSLYNLEALARGEIDFALVQADNHYLAAKGLGDYEGHPMTELRSVLSLHAETFTILARPDAGISGVESLRGKRINIGNPGSGTRATWDEVEGALGMQRSDFSAVSELRPDAAAELLCKNELDASLLVIGHPSKAIEAELSACALVMVPVKGPTIDKLVLDKPYFVPTIIRKEAYGLPADVPSFGGKATLVTSTAAGSADVQSLAKTLIGSLDELKGAQPNLAYLNAEEMVRHSLTAPLHDGAKLAYQEVGLLPE